MATPDPPRTPVQIVVNIHVAPDGSASLEQLPQGAPRGDLQGDPPQDPPAASKPEQLLDSLSLEKLLAVCRVVRPAELVDLYDAERIRDVCKAALAAPRHNLGGWVASALKKGWKVK